MYTQAVALLSPVCALIHTWLGLQRCYNRMLLAFSKSRLGHFWAVFGLPIIVFCQRWIIVGLFLACPQLFLAKDTEGQPITNYIIRPLGAGTKQFAVKPITCSNAWPMLGPWACLTKCLKALNMYTGQSVHITGMVHRQQHVKK